MSKRKYGVKQWFLEDIVKDLKPFELQVYQAIIDAGGTASLSQIAFALGLSASPEGVVVREARPEEVYMGRIVQHATVEVREPELSDADRSKLGEALLILEIRRLVRQLPGRAYELDDYYKPTPQSEREKGAKRAAKSQERAGSKSNSGDLTLPEQRTREAIKRSGATDGVMRIVAPWIEEALTSRLGKWIVADLKRPRFTMKAHDHINFSAQAVVKHGENFEKTALVPFKWQKRGRDYKSVFDFGAAVPL